jgi:predicted metal-binding protein
MSKKRLPEITAVQTVPTGWTDTLLICRKCSKKLKGGFGPDGDDTLRQAARATLREAGRRGEVGVLEIGCVGICPKRAVTTARASQPGIFRIVPAGSRLEGVLG